MHPRSWPSSPPRTSPVQPLSPPISPLVAIRHWCESSPSSTPSSNYPTRSLCLLGRGSGIGREDSSIGSESGTGSRAGSCSQRSGAAVRLCGSYLCTTAVHCCCVPPLGSPAGVARVYRQQMSHTVDSCGPVNLIFPIGIGGASATDDTLDP